MEFSLNFRPDLLKIMDSEDTGISNEEICPNYQNLRKWLIESTDSWNFVNPLTLEVEGFHNTDNSSIVPSSFRSDNVNTLESVDQGISDSDDESCSNVTSKNKGKGKSLKRRFHKGNEDSDNDAYSVSTVNSDRDTNYCNTSKTSKTVLL